MQGRITAAALLALLALLWPYLAERYHTLRLFQTNHPDRLHQRTAFLEYEIKFTEQVRNCEDVVLVEGERGNEGVAILSCDPGRDRWNTVLGTFIDPSPAGSLFQWYYNDPDETPKPIAFEGIDFSKDFHPLGIEYHAESRTLFVVNHASTGPTIELFDYTPWNGFGRAVARHVRTIKHPLVWTPNSILALNANELLVTNDHFFRVRERPLLAKLETYLAIPGGGVIHIDLGAEDAKNSSGTATPSSASIRTLASIPFANGIARLNATAVAVASTSRHSVQIFALARGAHSNRTALRRAREISAPFFVDNLSVDARGALLLAGHPHPPSLDALVGARTACARVEARAPEDPWTPREWRDAERCAELQARGLVAPTRVALWDGGEEGVLRDVYVSTGFGSGTTAVRDWRAGKVVVVGLYERGVLIADL